MTGNAGAAVDVVTFALGAATVSQTINTSGLSSANVTATATTFGDSITTGDGADILTANTGNDTLIGGAGADTITAVVNNGVNTLTGGDGTDTITGGTGIDTISGGAGVDIINGSGGADIIATGGGADVLTFTSEDSVAATATSTVGAATIAAGDTLTFGNSLIIISDFTAGTGGDNINVAAATAAVTGIGQTENALNAGNTFLSGTFAAGTGIFTVAADGTGQDTLYLEAIAATAGTLDIGTSASMILLQGVDSDDLNTANFV